MLIQFRRCEWTLALMTSFVLPGPGNAADFPSSPKKIEELSVLGQPLATALPGIGRQCDLSLSTGRSLSTQRVTLVGRDVPVEHLTQGLVELLSASRQDGVQWANPAPRQWRLDESLSRQTLARRLRDSDVISYSQHLLEQISWATREGTAAAVDAASGPGSLASRERLAHALFLRSLGAAGLRGLMAGTAVCRRVGDMQPMLRDRFRRLLADRHGLGGMSTEQLDRFAYAYDFARDPMDPRGSFLTISVVMPDGVAGARHGMFGLLLPRVLPSNYGPLNFPAPPASDTSRKATFVLVPELDARPGKIVDRNLDQLLGEVGRAYGVTIVADGYLRPPAKFAANLKLSGYPIRTLMDRLVIPWGCNWRFLDAERKVILLRARSWWMEDAADVPETTLREMRAMLGPGREAKLSELATFAELSPVQAHKLVECGVCPAAEGVVRPGWYDEGSGARPWLRLFRRLTPQQKERVLSAKGLPLGEAPVDAVDELLTTPLIVRFGTAAREGRAALVLSIQPVGALTPTLELSVLRPDGSGFRQKLRARLN